MRRSHVAWLCAGAGGLYLFSKGSGSRDMPPQGFPTDTDPRRLAVVAVARAELGKQDPSKYWDAVLPPAQQNSGFVGEWCGGFALWCLRQAGLAQNVNWEIGKGFCYRLPITLTPEPGDVVYLDQPYQHHAILSEANAERVITIDGNQAGDTVRLVTRQRSRVTAFFSIAPLLEKAQTT